MNRKRIKIKYRFIFQLALFILYVLILCGILFFMIHKIRGDKTNTREIQKTGALIAENHITYKNLLQNIKAGDRLYYEGENSYTENFHNTLMQLRNTLQLAVNESPLLSRNSESIQLDSVLQLIDEYQITFRHTILTLKELGDRNSGKINLVHNYSGQLFSFLLDFNDPDIPLLCTRLNNHLHEYLSNPGRTRYNELISLLDGLVYHPAFPDDDYAFINDLQQRVEKYKAALDDVHTTFHRLNTSNEKGLYAEMDRSLFRIVASFDQLILSIDSLQKKQTLWLILLCSLIIFILSAGYIVLFISFYRRFSQPLSTSTDFCFNLSKGKNPDYMLSTDVPSEISDLNENLIHLANSIKEKRHFVDNLLKQKFDIDLSLQGKQDTFGKTLIALKENMRKAREEQVKHAEENQIRRYQNEGIAKFSDILRNNSDNLDKLSDVFIKEIVRYLEAIQGGLFLIEDGNDNLKLTSAFAYNRKKYITKEINLGEGLIGTCAVEKKTIVLSDIPEDYIEMTSGLGDAPPDNLLIIPVIHEEQLIGVVEIASLKKFDANQISLCEKIASSLASTIINARINTQTSLLLEKSQQHAQQMAEQEEEMRQNMEELKATQEESARREEELESILAAIDQSFYVLEYDIEGLIIKANKRFLTLVNLPADKVIGLKHIQLFGKNSKANASLFANVSEGNTVELKEKVSVNNKQLDIKNTFSPIRTKDGDTLRILNIITVGV